MSMQTFHTAAELEGIMTTPMGVASAQYAEHIQRLSQGAQAMAAKEITEWQAARYRGMANQQNTWPRASVSSVPLDERLKAFDDGLAAFKASRAKG